MPPVSATLAPSPPTLTDLLGSLSSRLVRVEQHLQEQLTSKHATVDRVVRHGYRLGGKRLRPALLLLAGDACGGTNDEHLLLASVVELIHTATLVHDDVLDEADLRRHVDTVNARWSNETSVLLGDFLFSRAFYLASTLGTTDACRLIGRTTNRVCEGEMLQTLGERNFELSVAEYFEIIDAKTAELCACCCELGARHAGASDKVTQALSNYGRNLGLAFQIADDLLDLVGDEQQVGKSLGRDLAKGKLTLPVLHARDTLMDGGRRRFVEQLRRGDVAESYATLHEARSLDYASDQAQQFADRAVTALDAVPASATRDQLVAVARFVVQRQS